MTGPGLADSGPVHDEFLNSSKRSSERGDAVATEGTAQ